MKKVMKVIKKILNKVYKDSEEEAINEMAYKKIDFFSIHNKPMSISFI
jgi:hypothetical protein